MIIQAKKEHAPQIARLIMRAMTIDCCLHFCGEGYTPDDFYRVMTGLVQREDTQYSYLNTICAIDETSGIVTGIIVSYDGGKLLQLRQAFLDVALKEWGRDLSDMPEETSAGELYLDSLAVLPEYEGRGIATSLIAAAAEKGDHMGLPLGLLVDADNPHAERLYLRLGFRQVGVDTWGGHPMKRLLKTEN